MKPKSYFNNFLVVVVKNGCDILGPQTLKSAVLQGAIDKMSCFLYADINLRKPKVTIIIIS